MPLVASGKPKPLRAESELFALLSKDEMSAVLGLTAPFDPGLGDPLSAGDEPPLSGAGSLLAPGRPRAFIMASDDEFADVNAPRLFSPG